MKAVCSAVYVETRYHDHASAKIGSSTAGQTTKRCTEQNAVAARLLFQPTSL